VNNYNILYYISQFDKININSYIGIPWFISIMLVMGLYNNKQFMIIIMLGIYYLNLINPGLISRIILLMNK